MTSSTNGAIPSQPQGQAPEIRCSTFNVRRCCRAVSYDEGHQFAKENGLAFFEVSAKTAHNVEEAVITTAQKIYDNVQRGLYVRCCE